MSTDMNTNNNTERSDSCALEQSYDELVEYARSKQSKEFNDYMDEIVQFSYKNREASTL